MIIDYVGGKMEANIQMESMERLWQKRGALIQLKLIIENHGRLQPDRGY
jgi:hypothetical protein